MFILTIQYPDRHDEVEEEHESLDAAVDRVAGIESLPWMYDRPTFSITDSEGIEQLL